MNQWTMDKPSDEQLGGLPHLQVGDSRINPREIVTFCCQEAVEGPYEIKVQSATIS